jgi:acyl-CoA synthetase (AMP-forming)/AMP-acid ligase II
VTTERERVRAEVRAELIGPGGLFETTAEVVRGWPVDVFASRAMSIRDMAANTEGHGDNEFMVLADQRITYPQFRQQVASVAAGLVAHGVQPCDRVGIIAANRPEWVVSFFAVASIGAITAAYNGWWTPTEIQHATELTEPKVIIGDTKRLERLGPVHEGTLVLDIDADFADLVATPAEGLPTVPLAEDDPALILFTSGTTGRAKGTLISHRGMVGFVQSAFCAGAERMFIEDRLGNAVPAGGGRMAILMTSPLFHLSGLFAGVLIGVSTGAKLVFRSGRFDPEDVLRLIDRERVTNWAALGSMGPRVLDCPALATTDVSSITNLGFGGAPVTPELQQRMRDAFPSAATSVGMGYGSSESVAVATMIGGPDLLDHPLSCGTTTATFEIEIRDENGRSVPDGTDGGAYVRSPYTMLGYWNDPETTAATLSDDGWLSMGDIGHMEAGFLTLNSRARDMILRAAENIAPAEIELRLAAHPDVGEAAVVGVDHPELGQEVKAFVVPRSGATITEADLEVWVGETLAPFKVPSLWEITTEELPRNASGKVVKTALTGERALDQFED